MMKAPLMLLLLTAITRVSAANLDNPLPPVNPVATMSDDFSLVTLTWGYPGDVGENGGYVDQNKITYYIFDAFASYYAPAIAVTQATSHVFDYSNISGQDFVAYQLTAGMDETWYSLPVNSNIVCVGQPHPLPFSETFAAGKQTYPWCVGTDSSWDVTSSIDRDDTKPYGQSDGGCLSLISKSAGQSFSITSVKVAPEDAAAIAIRLSARGKDCELSVEVASDGGEFSQIATVTPGDEWHQFDITTDVAADTRYMQIRLRTHFQADNAWLRIDDIGAEKSQSGGIMITPSDRDQTHTEYFTIDGHRLTGRPTAPGIYISRSGDSAKKILVR